MMKFWSLTKLAGYQTEDSNICYLSGSFGTLFSDKLRHVKPRKSS